MKKICCLTATGDRPCALDLSREYILRSIIPDNHELEWLVIDDGMIPYNPGNCHYIRRNPDGKNSLGRNLITGLAACDADYILFWEDDDWYSKDRIFKQVQFLDQYDLHGWCKTVYFNVKNRSILRHNNGRHASLFETGFTNNLFNEIQKLILDNINKKYFDMMMWKAYRERGLLTPFDATCLGIKGMPGRHGLSGGHGDSLLPEVDLNLEKLHNWIGNDVKNYDSLRTI